MKSTLLRDMCTCAAGSCLTPTIDPMAPFCNPSKVWGICKTGAAKYGTDAAKKAGNGLCFSFRPGLNTEWHPLWTRRTPRGWRPSLTCLLWLGDDVAGWMPWSGGARDASVEEICGPYGRLPICRSMTEVEEGLGPTHVNSVNIVV